MYTSWTRTLTGWLPRAKNSRPHSSCRSDVMSIRGTHCRAVPACPLSLSLLSLHGGSENCQSSDWLVPDKGPLNGRVCVCVGVWTLVGPRNHDTRGPGAPRVRGILGGAPGDVAFCRNSVTTCCVMTQRCSATFAARSHSL